MYTFKKKYFNLKKTVKKRYIHTYLQEKSGIKYLKKT